MSKKNCIFLFYNWAASNGAKFNERKITKHKNVYNKGKWMTLAFAPVAVANSTGIASHDITIA